ncbi:MAG: AAA family ATPase [Candidatus Heimdallarchaeota archaeon]|nr:AAA family ATPase [Candidatus Heimdallarchaeota archaeon]MCK5048069.1 AAA family ATPase [Candidatus Heimdallarchaeota archaeon]
MIGAKIDLSHTWISSVHVKNYRSLVDVSMCPVEKICLCVGENNSGKTNFLNALDCALGEIHGEEFLLARDFDDRDQPLIIQIGLQKVEIDSMEGEISLLDTDYSSKRGTDILSLVFEYTLNRNEISEKIFLEGIEIARDQLFLPKYAKFLASPPYVEWKDSELGSLIRLLGTDHIFMSAQYDNLIEKAYQTTDRLMPGFDIEHFLKRVSERYSHLTPSSILSKIWQFGKFFTGPVPISSKHDMSQRSIAIDICSEFIRWDHSKGSLLIGVEEPEIHLHPHSQRQIFNGLRNISNFVQTLVVSHSNNGISHFNIWDIALFRKVNNYTTINKVTPDFFQKSDKLKQRITPTFSEIFFSRGVILVEGVTEKGALPIFGSKLRYKGVKVNLDSFGIGVIPVYGSDFRLYVKMLKFAYKIPVSILYDGDATFKVYNGLLEVGLIEVDEKVDVENNKQLENILAKHGAFAIRPNFEEVFIETQPDLVLRVLEEGFNDDWLQYKEESYETIWEKEVLNFLKGNKPRFGRLVSEYAKSDEIPVGIRDTIIHIVSQVADLEEIPKVEQPVTQEYLSLIEN